MTAVLKRGASEERCGMLIERLKKQGLGVHVSRGEFQTVIGLVGNTDNVNMEMLRSSGIIDSVTRVSDPFRAVGRMFKPDDSVININDGALSEAGRAELRKVPVNEMIDCAKAGTEI